MPIVFHSSPSFALAHSDSVHWFDDIHGGSSVCAGVVQRAPSYPVPTSDIDISLYRDNLLVYLFARTLSLLLFSDTQCLISDYYKISTEMETTRRVQRLGMKDEDGNENERRRRQGSSTET